MEPECRDLMLDAISVNYIDTEEYPSTEKIKESRAGLGPNQGLVCATEITMTICGQE